MLGGLGRSCKEFREDAFGHLIWVYRYVVGVEVDNPYFSMHVLPEFCLPVFSKLSGPHLGFSCRCFPSLVERREPCRCKSGSADVVGISPCSICRPSLPARYAPGVGERFGGWSANYGLPINGIPFRRFAGDCTNSFGCRHLLCPLSQLIKFSGVQHHGEVCPLSRSVM